MLTAFSIQHGALQRIEAPLSGPASGPKPVWLDLHEPTAEEDKVVEAILGVSVPTRAEMQEIETSSRLYAEDGALYMTATVIAKADSDRPITTPITFILAGHALCTVRYESPRAIAHYETKAAKNCGEARDGRGVLFGLLDAIVDRVADVLETVGAEIDQIQSLVFSHDIRIKGERAGDYAWIIRSIGREGYLIGKIEESLTSLTRLFLFLGDEAPLAGIGAVDKAHLETLQADVRSLADFARSLDAKVGFLLSATLGLVSLQQNTIVKIFSVLAVVFMPPTLIASIYGMNFKIMPELEWTHGYPFALSLMVASVGVTFALFKWRGWL